MTHSVVFERISSVNFCSAGQQPVHIPLNVAPLTVICGENGSGKSTLLLDALTFALYNTPYRNVTKNDLVNYLLGEGTKVTLQFSINGVPHTVVRGINPNLFEVHIDGKKVSLPKHARDQQTYFETEILKFSKAAFLQTCILGKAGYTPFLQLPAAQRRAVVEDLLDLAVFSRMHVFVKEDVAAQKVQSAETAATLRAAEEHFHSIERLQNEAERGWKDKRKGLLEKIEIVSSALRDIVVPDAPDPELMVKYGTASTKLSQQYGDLTSRKRRLETVLRNIDDSDLCPTCGQKIDNTHKKAEKEKATAELADINITLMEVNEKQAKINERVQQIKVVQQAHDAAERERTSTQLRLEGMQELLNEMDNDGPPQLPDVDSAQQRLSEAKRADEISKKKMDIYLAANRLLKDDGIKGSVVRRYLPAMVSQLNAILRHFDLDIRFLFSETFEETIYRHGVHKLKIDNFSEGEKLRIELALLFCWRALAQQKASLDTNLLVMDEILDASLDDAGCSQLMKQLKEIGGSNTFVISHRKLDELSTDFDAVLHFRKVGHYTSVERIEL